MSSDLIIFRLINNKFSLHLTRQLFHLFHPDKFLTINSSDDKFDAKSANLFGVKLGLYNVVFFKNVCDVIKNMQFPLS